MREPNYQEVFSHSWQMVKEHKILWVFGLLSVCLGQWGLANFLGGLNFASLNNLVLGLNWSLAKQALLIFVAGGTINLLFIVWLALIVLALVALVVFVAVVSRGALIAAVGHWFAKNGKVPTALAWRYGVKRFWEILSLNILGRAAQAAFLLLAVLVFAYHDSSIVSLVIEIFYGALTLAAGLIVEAIMIFASGYVVIDGANVPAAVARGWRLFTRHVLVTLELGILLTLFGLAVAILTMLLSSAVFIPAILIWFVALLTGWDALLGAGAILAVGLFLIIFVLIAGIFNAFNTSAWMYLFIKMHRENYAGLLLRRIKDFFSK